MKKVDRDNKGYTGLQAIGDSTLIGLSGLKGYQTYRLGDFLSRLNRKSTAAFDATGLANATLNKELLQDLDTLARGITDSGSGANAYTYATQMHSAANKPLFIGRKAIGSEEGLNEFHQLIRNLGDNLTDDLAGAFNKAKRTAKRIGIIDKNGYLKGSNGGIFLDIPADPGPIKDWIRGMSAVKGEGRAWDASLKHFQAFKESPLDGYRQLIYEAEALGNPIIKSRLPDGKLRVGKSLTFGNVAGLLEESKNFKARGFPSRESYLRDLLFSKMNGMFVGSAKEAPGAFEPLLADLASRGGGDYNGFLWNTVGPRDYMLSDKGVIATERHLEKARKLDAILAQKGLPPKFEDLVSRTMSRQRRMASKARKALSPEEAIELMAGDSPFVNVLNRIGKPMSGRRFGMQHLSDAMRVRTVANNIADPFAAALARRNASAYGGIGKGLLLADMLRSGKVKFLGKALKALGIAVPVATTGLIARNRLRKEGSYEGISELGRFVTNAGGVADPGVSRILTTKPDIMYRIGRLKGPALITGATLLAIAGFLRARPRAVSGNNGAM